MRLLHTQTLKLHEFFGADIRPYAILSHTWDEGEVSCQEWQSGDANQRQVTTKSAAAVKWQLQTGSHMSGWILVASTRQAVPNSQKPSTPCISGIDSLRSVMSIWQMFLVV